jgi:hypothetical protein
MSTIAPTQPSPQPPATASPELPPAGALSFSNLAGEAREFCTQKQIESEVETTIVLARKSFTISGQPWFRVVHDSESGEHYVSIHVRVAGTPDEVFAQGEAFLNAFLTTIDPEKQKYLSLIYHSMEGTV